MFLPRCGLYYGMKKILLITLILLTLGAIIVVGAVVYELTIPGNVVVIETPGGDYEVKAYQDAVCTIPLTNVDWGTMQCGEMKEVHFYVKNTGDQDLSSVTADVDSPVNYGGGHGYGVLSVGQSYEVRATFHINPTASPGSYSANVEISCTA